jgi:tRNA(Ile)-lysidine synthase
LTKSDHNQQTKATDYRPPRWKIANSWYTIHHMDDPKLQGHPVSHSLLATVLAAQHRHQLFPTSSTGRSTTVVVGVSGGADSVALLHSLLQLRQCLRLDLHVAHLDHVLRPESGQDAAFVAQLAKDWGLPFYQQRLTPGALAEQAGGLEEAGRRARYTFFAQVAINVTPPAEVPCVALAHHADDQAETVLLHLVRGSGLRGLGGMRPVQLLTLRTWRDDPALSQVRLRVVRPLLGVRKAEIVNYLQAHHLPWREDTSNQSRAFVRNRLRHEVLPLLATLNPGVVATLGRTAAILAAENERAERLDRQALATLWVDQEQTSGANRLDRVVLDLAGLRQLDQATQRGVLRQALAQLAPPETDSTFEQLEGLLAYVEQPTRTCGPHPLYQNVAWSMVGPTATQPALLSLHWQDQLPFQPDQPYLTAAWRQQYRERPLVAAGQLRLESGWTLQHRTLVPDQLPADWRQSDHRWRVYVDAAQLGQAVLAAPRPGLKFAPLGLQGKHKQLGDFFTDQKIPPALRPGWPLLIDRQTDTLLWVCGLAIAHSVRITEQTEQVVEWVWRKS